MTNDQPAEKTNRADALLAARDTKMRELFENRKYEVVREVHLEGDERFETPFGNKGRHGFVLKEVGGDATFVVGRTVVEHAAGVYGAVDVPAPERKRRTAEQKAEDDAREAEERAARRAEKDNARAEKAAAREQERAAKAAAREQARADKAAEREAAKQAREAEKAAKAKELAEATA